MGSTALAFAAVFGGAIVIEYGVRHTRDAFGNAASNVSSPAAPTASTDNTGKTYGQVTYSQVAAIGQRKGWSKAQVDDWFNHLIPSESNGTVTDTNPSSGAYGIAQGITGPKWYAQYGGDSRTVGGQLTAMANYIALRYGNPSAAWSFHQQHNWY